MVIILMNLIQINWVSGNSLQCKVFRSSIYPKPLSLHTGVTEGGGGLKIAKNPLRNLWTPPYPCLPLTSRQKKFSLFIFFYSN